MGSPVLCEEQSCSAMAAEKRSFATKSARSRIDLLLCDAHDAALDRGVSFEIISEQDSMGWRQYIIISPVWDDGTAESQES